MNSKLPISSVVLSFFLCGCAGLSNAPRADLLGTPATPSAATRSIVISPDTKWVNVTGGEIINFVVGDQTFAWSFNTALSVDNFDLLRVAPPGVLAHSVEAYVAPDPRYIGAGGHGGGMHGGMGGGHR